MDKFVDFITNLPIILAYTIPIYVVFCLIISIVMFKRIRKYFPLSNNISSNNLVFQGTDSNNNLIDVENEDDQYPEFKRYDYTKFLFVRLLFGTLTFALLRFIFFIIFVAICVIFITMINCFGSIIHGKNRKYSKSTRIAIRVFTFITLTPMKVAIGFFTWNSKLNDKRIKEIYCKYFGPDYDFKSKSKYSMLIANHHGWQETLHWLVYKTPGFIAKKEMANIPLVGSIIYGIDCLLVNRQDRDDRHKMVLNMKERQENYMQGKTTTPLLIYPEGTVSSGKYILEFKKGAFMNLMPLKPLYSEIDDGNGIYLCPMPFFEHMFYTFCYIWTFSRFYELPIIECNDYMLKNHSSEGELPEDTYAKVANLIYQEAFNLKFSNKTYKDLDNYELICSKRNL